MVSSGSSSTSSGGSTSPSPPSPPPPVSVGGSGDDDSPCFARSTTACRVVDATTPAAAAFTACFEETDPAVALRVPMTDLTSGDLVLSSDNLRAASPSVTRVVVNQHVHSSQVSSMIDLRHTRGTLSLTPDHVLLVDGVFVPARTVQVGARLSFNATVTAVGFSTGGIISPLTLNGHILAAGPTGAPVAATVWPEWIADTMLATTIYPLPHSFSSLSARLFPERVQVCNGM